MEHRSGRTRVLGSGRLLVVVAAVAFCLFVASPAHANLVTNGSFETGTPPPPAGFFDPSGFATLGTGSTAITGWTVTGASIDWIDTYWTAADGNRSIDLDGLGAGGVTTSFGTTPGQKYRLSFYMAGNPDSGPNPKTLDVSSNSFLTQSFSFDASGQSHTNMGWVPETFYFTASGTTTTLSFDSTLAGAFGPALDNVDVEVVPEPGTLMLLGAGLSALGIVRRRRA